MADWAMSVADLPSLTTLVDDTQQPNGSCWSVRDTGDGTAGWFYLSSTSTATLVAGKVIATQSGTGRWIRVGLMPDDIPSPIAAGTGTPSGAPDGSGIYVQFLSSPQREVWWVWDETNSSWVASHASAMTGNSEALPSPDKDGQFAIDDMNNTLYVGIGGTWYTVAEGMI